MPYNFNKTALNTPVTASYIDDSGMDSPSRKLLGNVLALVGYDANLNPNTIYRFNSYAAARAKLSNNVNTLKSVAKAFNPSKEALAPDYIQFVSVGVDEDNATTTLLDTSVSAISAITLTAKEAREAGVFSVRIATGTPTPAGAPTKNVTVDGVTVNDVLSLPLKLAFTVNGAILTAASIVVSRTSVVITPTGSDSVVRTIPINDDVTIAQLAQRINAAAVGVVATVMNLLGTKPATILDSLATTSITTLKLYATTQAVVDVINANFGTKVTATRATGNVKVVANATQSLIYTAPVSTDITVTEWAAALTKLEEIDVQWVVPLSDAVIAHEAVKTHCETMSDVAFMERRAIVGSPISTTNSAAIALANNDNLSSDRVSMVHQGFYDGSDVLYPPYVLAALLGGMMCGLTPGTAMTNKTINVTGMDSRLKNPSDTDTLLTGGILCCWQDFAGNVKVLQSITTSTNRDNFNQREISVGVASDYVARAIRETLDPLRGKKNTPYLSTEVLSRVESRLKQLAIDEPLGEGVLVGDAKNPAYRGITVTTAADSITVEFECSPVIPCNYIGIVVHTVPYIG